MHRKLPLLTLALLGAAFFPPLTACDGGDPAEKEDDNMRQINDCQVLSCSVAAFDFAGVPPTGSYDLSIETPEGMTTCTLDADGDRESLDVECSGPGSVSIEDLNILVNDRPDQASATLTTPDGCSVSAAIDPKDYQDDDCGACPVAMATLDLSDCEMSFGGAGGGASP